MTAAYKIEYLTYTLASSISDIVESPKVTNVDLVMKSSISENINNRSGCQTIVLPVRMFDKNFFMKNLEIYRTQWVPKLETDPKLETVRGELRFKTNHE